MKLRQTLVVAAAIRNSRPLIVTAAVAVAGITGESVAAGGLDVVTSCPKGEVG